MLFCCRLFCTTPSSPPQVVKSVVAPNRLAEFPLTAENVELVLDEVRPYLISDGGNVVLHEIDGNVFSTILEKGILLR
ncbi:hypothetical protein ZIOFF_035716 [Zingiber officinale]|uniref:NIF system FeS cluster assembly NifU C-terminal domain-containing protein n=1 Tax=Zingiber officinale TaxID=94328 RepID=A0A8J5G9J6_ZINOF|nr:hypothetical protein ZIOFF_035716 [Zingiber officinale]